ncbi:hypothetical protein PHYSODRAFT_336002 [Phytophthora sojae]|uniref:Elicitin n=2 Tax=Phytophthora sojae TaxID=67593 RepID=G4ZVF4_PHYSP|nr:hypothetical protein PHYSODRAFT_336002 [Phytophthora sojae]ABB56014.1 elicitin-like protein SOL13G [Phytophthora sojae]EGZ11472.1 hypothetical protein PHYSODRAFT_336002 [Phytophthora sojae]|eukprot:XP_009531805.1 hypothetical protein PHYSODRAFT_336002 [Phytophthora sojae]
MRQLASLLTVVAFTLAPLGALAAECTDAEVAHDDELWAWAATQSACAPYASGTSYFNWPCDASDCTAILASMAASMSDCTYSGVSNKIEVQNAITVCTGGDTTDPGSPSTDTPSTTAPSPTATASNTDCAASEISDMVDLYTAAASSDECADDSSVSSSSIVITTFCGSACASKLEELATSLPNCYYGYQSENLKADLLEQLDGCSGEDTSYAINVVLNPEEAMEAPATTTSPPTTTQSPPSTTSPPDSTTAPDTNSTSEPTPAPTEGDSGAYC